MSLYTYAGRGFVLLPCLKQQLRYVSSSEMKPVVTLYTKKECSLCDVLKEEMQPHYNKVQYSDFWMHRLHLLVFLSFMLDNGRVCCVLFSDQI